MTAVLDASLVMQYFLESDSPQALALDRLLEKVADGDIDLAAPHLLTIEVTNSLKNSNSTAAERRAFLNALFGLSIAFMPLTANAHQIILQWAEEMNTATYDVAYHVLAWQLGGTFFTCDRKYYEKAKGKGCIALV